MDSGLRSSLSERFLECLHNTIPLPVVMYLFQARLEARVRKGKIFFFIFMMNAKAFFSKFGGFELLKVCLMGSCPRLIKNELPH